MKECLQGKRGHARQSGPFHSCDKVWAGRSKIWSGAVLSLDSEREKGECVCVCLEEGGKVAKMKPRKAGAFIWFS